MQRVNTIATRRLGGKVRHTGEPSASDRRATAESPGNESCRQRRQRQWSMRICLSLPPNTAGHSSTSCVGLQSPNHLPPLDPGVRVSQPNSHRIHAFPGETKSQNVRAPRSRRRRQVRGAVSCCPLVCERPELPVSRLRVRVLPGDDAQVPGHDCQQPQLVLRPADGLRR